MKLHLHVQRLLFVTLIVGKGKHRLAKSVNVDMRKSHRLILAVVLHLKTCHSVTRCNMRFVSKLGAWMYAHTDKWIVRHILRIEIEIQ